MNDEFIKVPKAWLETLVRHAKNVQEVLDREPVTENSDLRSIAAGLVGHAESAETLLTHGQKVK